MKWGVVALFVVVLLAVVDTALWGVAPAQSSALGGRSPRSRQTAKSHVTKNAKEQTQTQDAHIDSPNVSLANTQQKAPAQQTSNQQDKGEVHSNLLSPE